MRVGPNMRARFWMFILFCGAYVATLEEEESIIPSKALCKQGRVGR